MSPFGTAWPDKQDVAPYEVLIYKEVLFISLEMFSGISLSRRQSPVWAQVTKRVHGIGKRSEC